MLVVHLLGYKLVQTIKHGEVSFFVKALNHKILELVDLPLNLVHKLVDVSICVLDLLVVVCISVLNLNLQHFKIVFVSLGV